MPHDPALLKQLSWHEMDGGQRIAAVRHGIVAPVRSERERQLRQRYNLTLEDYDQLYQFGSERCWACKELWHQYLYVDHDHKTGKIRGLLCAKCNTLAGAIEDSLERTMAILMYLYPGLFVACIDEAEMPSERFASMVPISMQDYMAVGVT